MSPSPPASSPVVVPAACCAPATAGAISSRASFAAAGAVTGLAVAVAAPATAGCGIGARAWRHCATCSRTSTRAAALSMRSSSPLPGTRSTAPWRSRLTLPRMKASGLARNSATIAWSRETPLSRARSRAIPDRVWPLCTGASVPAASAAAAGRGAAGTGAGAATGAVAVALAGAGFGVGVGVGAGTGAGAGSRTIRLDGAAAGASITGSATAVAVSGAATSAEYSRTSRPCPQSTSIRKLSAGTCTGVALVTRTTARPFASWANWNCSSPTSPSGRDRPTRSNVAADASPTVARSSSPGSLEITGISATSGCPGLDRTRILPRPRASAALLYSPSASTSTPCIERIAPLPLGFMPANIPAEPGSESRTGNADAGIAPASSLLPPPGWPQPPLATSSASCTALSAAPLRMLSATTHMFSPRGCERSSRIRPT